MEHGSRFAQGLRQDRSGYAETGIGKLNMD